MKSTTWRSRPSPQRPRPVHTAGGIHLFPGHGRCWLCGHTAVLLEKLPGKRHVSRALCAAHATHTYGKDVVAAVLPNLPGPQ